MDGRTRRSAAYPECASRLSLPLATFDAGSAQVAGTNVVTLLT